MDFAVGSVTGFTLGLLIAVFFTLLKAVGRLDSLDTRVRMLLKHHGIDMEQAATEQAREHLKAGNKIEAIKVYRALTGASLAEAKTAVERLPAA